MEILRTVLYVIAFFITLAALLVGIGLMVLPENVWAAEYKCVVIDTKIGTRKQMMVNSNVKFIDSFLIAMTAKKYDTNRIR